LRNGALGSGLLSTRWYLAEGYTNLTFHETLYLLNPSRVPAQVQVQLLSFNGRHTRAVHLTAPAQHVLRLDVNRIYPHVSLAAIVTSDRPLMVARVLTFADGSYGATANTGTARAATTWLFAEGSAAHGYQTFLTILNPGRTSATVTATLLDTRGHVLARQTIGVVGLHRGNVRFNDLTHAAAIASTVTSTQPIVVERPFYAGNPNAGHVAGSLVYGRNGPGLRWTFPAGDTTHGAHEDLLVLNPNRGVLALRATFYLASGQVVMRRVTVPAQARYTLHVNGVPGLANTLHGAQLTSTNQRGFIAEQSIYNSERTRAYGTAGLAQ
jgi:hypothetical protein